MNLEPIDTSTTAGKARVMQLAAEGRRVAYRNAKSSNAIWHEAGEDPMWNWYGREYAIIAGPVGPQELWVSFDAKGGIAAIYTSSPMAYQGVGLAHYRSADLVGRDE